MTPHRRQFIRGQWIPQTAESGANRATPEIASVLVQARPERLDAVQAAIAGIAGAEIAQRDARGKLVVILDSSAGAPIGDTLTKLSLMPDVISATLVFHGMDVG
jgi:nitrate reductase NapD